MTVTVVLVHGAFADASSWNAVIERLQDGGVAVQAVANPLRGLTADGEYVASAVSQIEGDVVLVGHSYGGPVITYASAKAPNVKALVYVASVAFDQGMSMLEYFGGFPDSLLGGALEFRNYLAGDEAAPEGYINRDQYQAVFAADLPDDVTRVNAAAQRPAALSAFGEPLAVEPGWKKLPSWFAVATEDHAIHPDAQRASAKTIGATAVEVPGSHSIAGSRPLEVAGLIQEAVKAVS
jgi:pimeloyl-ACP methyl ester carboxylesterase